MNSEMQQSAPAHPSSVHVPFTVEIRPFRSGDAEAFRRLNEEWIAKFFALESQDHITLRDPEGAILRAGGHIFMACVDNQPIGCCALMPHGPDVFELGKMTVAPNFQGRGIGRQILAYTIDQAKALGARSIFLGSNSKLANAVHLYEAVGFRRLPPEEVPDYPYARANVFMRLALS